MRKRWNANRIPIPRVFKLKLNQFHISTERIYFRSKILCFDILVRFTHSRKGGKIEKKIQLHILRYPNNLFLVL